MPPPATSSACTSPPTPRGEVIAGAVALANHVTVQQMAELWCAYLSKSEALKLAAQAFTRDISRLSCCAA
jgi:mercuric reductase